MNRKVNIFIKMFNYFTTINIKWAFYYKCLVVRILIVVWKAIEHDWMKVRDVAK